MSVSIQIPSALRAQTGGAATVEVEASTVEAALAALDAAHPRLQKNLRDANGKLRSFVNIYLNDEDIRFLPEGAGSALKAGDRIIIVPSIAGGAR
jgi:adenylyltransferase/sulfurtransferase